MMRKSSKKTAALISGTLYTDDEYTGTRIDTPAWLAWLVLGKSFYVELEGVGFTVRSQKRRNGMFWYAVKKLDGKTKSIYVGPSYALTLARLIAVLVPG